MASRATRGRQNQDIRCDLCRSQRELDHLGGRARFALGNAYVADFEQAMRNKLVTHPQS